MFRDYGMDPLRSLYSGYKSLPGSDHTTLEELAGLHLKVDGNMLEAIGSSRNDLTQFRGRVSVKSRMEWDVVNNQGFYLMRNNTHCVLAGHSARFSSAQGPFRINIQSPALCSVAIVSLDNQSLGSTSGNILITACGRCENTGKQFSDDRRTVGTKWGQAPVLIETVEGTVAFPETYGTGYTCKILNPDGTVKTEIQVTDNTVPLKAEYGTMWYLIECKPTD